MQIQTLSHLEFPPRNSTLWVTDATHTPTASLVSSIFLSSALHPLGHFSYQRLSPQLYVS